MNIFKAATLCIFAQCVGPAFAGDSDMANGFAMVSYVMQACPGETLPPKAYQMAAMGPLLFSPQDLQIAYQHVADVAHRLGPNACAMMANGIRASIPAG